MSRNDWEETKQINEILNSSHDWKQCYRRELDNWSVCSIGDFVYIPKLRRCVKLFQFLLKLFFFHSRSIYSLYSPVFWLRVAFNRLHTWGFTSIYSTVFSSCADALQFQFLVNERRIFKHTKVLRVLFCAYVLRLFVVLLNAFF